MNPGITGRDWSQQVACSVMNRRIEEKIKKVEENEEKLYDAIGLTYIVLELSLMTLYLHRI